MRFPFLCHVHGFSRTISLVSGLHYPYGCFFSHVCFQVYVVFLFDLMLLLLATVNSLSLPFPIYSSSLCIDASTQFSEPAILLPPFLIKYSRCDLWALWIVINFLVLWSFCLSSFVIYYYHYYYYFTRGNFSQSIFLSYGLFIWVPLSSIIIMIIIIMIIILPEAIFVSQFSCFMVYLSSFVVYYYYYYYLLL